MGMMYEGDPGVLQNLWKKARWRAEGDPRYAGLNIAHMGLGGTNRGIYCAGQNIELAKHGLLESLDVAVAVSTSTPAFCYAYAGQAELVPSIYTEEGTSREFISQARALTGGHPVDIKYAASVFRGLTGKMLQQERLRKARTSIYAVLAHGEKATPFFADLKTYPDIIEPIEAAIAIPISADPVMLRGTPFLDGSISAPLPARQVVETFCPTDILILANRREEDGADSFFLQQYTRLKSRRLPKPIVAAMERQESVFLSELAWLRSGACPARWGIIWSDGSVRALTRHRPTLERALVSARVHMRELLRAAA